MSVQIPSIAITNTLLKNLLKPIQVFHVVQLRKSEFFQLLTIHRNCEYIFEVAGNPTFFTCPLCTKQFCLKCKTEYHTNSTCEQYQQWLQENGRADELFDEFVIGKKYKQCPGCKRWIEKIDGCNHLTCICGFQL